MAKDKDVQDAILKTLCYADIFDYPLTASEIFSYLIWQSRRKPPSERILTEFLQDLHPGAVMVDGYYTLPGREELVELRKKRGVWSREKQQISERVGRWLRRIPTIKMVALTGALAMGNADEADDIDLMIITTGNRLWFTRALTVITTELLGVRRRPIQGGGALADRRVTTALHDKICLNLWLDETTLAIPEKRRNLYSAHEVVQLKPIWSRDGIYENFLSENTWITQYLPNIKMPVKSNQTEVQRARARALSIRETSPVEAGNLALLLHRMEQLAYRLQIHYMQSRRTRETVTLHSAFFHPRDTTSQILTQYRLRLRRLNLQPKP